jgi:hypothetical protein
MLVLFADNPFRPTDWRWQRAQELVSGRRRFNRRLDDATIYRLVKFQKELKKAEAGDENAYARMHDHSQDLYQLFMFHRLDDQYRYELEARLLSGQTNEEISSRSNMTPGAVQLFHDVFFDVRSRLIHPSFIVNGVMGASVHYGLNAREYDLLWKLIGYGLGPIMLEDMMSMRRYSFATTEDGIDPITREQIKNNLRRAVFTTSRTLSINSFNQQGIMEAWFRALELERASGTEAADSILTNISTALSSVHWSIGDSPVSNPSQAHARLVELRQTGVEPREEDLLLLGIDPNHVVDVPVVSFPEAAHAQNLPAE